MIVGIGVDIVEVPRIRRAVERYGDRFVGRIFTDQESRYCRRCSHPEQRFATRFAAKEAALKALGAGWSGGVRFLDVEVSNNHLGAPKITLAGKALEMSRKLKVNRMHVSLSHHHEFAVAQVILEGHQDGDKGRQETEK